MDQMQEKLQKRQNVIKEPKLSMISTIRKKMKSGSMTNLNEQGLAPRNSFSALVSGGTVSRNMAGTVQRKVFANKNRNNLGDDEFKVYHKC